MAFTQSQTLADTDRRHLFKRVNSGNTESAALLVNAASLNWATSVLTLTAGSNTFTIGETVNAASGGSGVVRQIVNATAVQLTNANGTFTASTTITGNTSGLTRVQSGSLAADTKTLQVQRVLFDICPAAASVLVEWEGDGTSNHRAVSILSGQGVLEFDTHGARIPNNAVNPTGNLIITTNNWDANSHYTLVVDVSKASGYGVPVRGY